MEEQPGPDISDIGRKAGRGAVWSLLGTLVTRAGSFVLGLVLARLLAPADFGIYAVALAATQLVMVVKDVGVMSAVVQWRGRLEEIAPHGDDADHVLRARPVRALLGRRPLLLRAGRQRGGHPGGAHPHRGHPRRGDHRGAQRRPAALVPHGQQHQGRAGGLPGQRAGGDRAGGGRGRAVQLRLGGSSSGPW
ncbi:hypothetical protein GCM10020001_052110 [Nonomuraea salmonea]